MINSVLHEFLSLTYSSAARKLTASSLDVESAQRRILRQIIKNVGAGETWSGLNPDDSYEQLREQIGIHDYSWYEGLIQKQRDVLRPVLARSVQRYEPTSGSTNERKWIPYPPEFLAELNRAAAAWLGDVYRNKPAVKRGRHYWSLSWLPEQVRTETTSNDAELFPWYQRVFLQSTLAVKPQVATLPKSEQAWWATLLSLAACEDLTLVSVWSPTFWLKITEDLKRDWREISKALERGEWGRDAEIMRQKLGAPPKRNLTAISPESDDFYRRLWPRLQLISAWDSSSSVSFAGQIRDLFPHVQFQGKGLWATEGVVTIPFAEKKVLAIDSHFFEFRDLARDEVLPAWNLRPGFEYQPLLWTSSGLLRYPLPDRLLLTEYFNSVPCFEFQGRIRSCDLVGEKISSSWVEDLFERYKDWRPFSLVAVRKPQPHYVLLCQSRKPIDVEGELQTLHHYQLARQLGQLKAARVQPVRDIFEVLSRTGKSQILGQNKIEILIEVEKLS